MRRVVVTGIGLVTPVGNNAKDSWEAIKNGKNGFQKIDYFDPTPISCHVAAQLKDFDSSEVVPKKEARRMDKFVEYALVATQEAVEDSGWQPTEEHDLKRTGVLVGSGIGGMQSIQDGVTTFREHGHKKVGPFFIPSILINIASGHIAIKHGFRGPNHSVVTACSTGGHAIGDAARLIALDDADVMIAGSSEAAIVDVSVTGFAAARALSSGYNDTPEQASRPWDKGRDGFVMGEGAGIVVLEEYEHAKKRGATIYGEVIGYGLSGDAFHITAPHDEGRGGYDAMEAAVKRAGVNVDEIGYVNAHGTSTPKGDLIELNAVKRLFGSAISSTSMSSTKSAIGHLLGGAGSVEGIFSMLAMRDGVLPPTLNLTDPEDDCEGVDLVPLEAKEKKVDIALSNSFGFGGTNVSLVFKKV